MNQIRKHEEIGESTVVYTDVENIKLYIRIKHIKHSDGDLFNFYCT